MGRISRGAAALAAFIARHCITRAAAARALGVSSPTIHDWVVGVKSPKQERRLRIERWTSGEVPASWWVSAADASTLDEVRPHQPDPDEAG